MTYKTAYIWVQHESREVLLTNLPGIPQAICMFVSRQAKRQAISRGYALTEELTWPADCYLGEYSMPAGGGWGEAESIARREALRLGYTVNYKDQNEKIPGELDRLF